MIIENYPNKIIEMVRGKRLLDVGVIGDLGKTPLCGQYRKRYEVASEAFGIDIDSESIDKAFHQGTRGLICGDICKQSDIMIIGQFEIITATDLIEHLFNLGDFLDNVRLLLSPKGQLVIVTINVFCVRYFHRKLIGDTNFSKEHTCWFDETTLTQLLQFKGFKIDELFYAVPPTEKEMASLGLTKLEDWMCKRIGVVSSL